MMLILNREITELELPGEMAAIMACLQLFIILNTNYFQDYELESESDF